MFENVDEPLVVLRVTCGPRVGQPCFRASIECNLCLNMQKVTAFDLQGVRFSWKQ